MYDICLFFIRLICLRFISFAIENDNVKVEFQDI